MIKLCFLLNGRVFSPQVVLYLTPQACHRDTKKKQRTIGSILRPNIFFFLNIGSRMEENVISNWRIITSLLQRIIIRNDIIWYFHVYFLWTNDRFTSGSMFRFHQFVSKR